MMILIYGVVKSMYYVIITMNSDVTSIYYVIMSIYVLVLLYRCEIWGFTNLQMIERLHLKFCKILLNLKKSTPTYMVYSELDAKPLSNIVKSRIINYWSRIVQNNDLRLNHVLYKLMIYKYVNNGIDIKWLSCVKTY